MTETLQPATTVSMIKMVALTTIQQTGATNRILQYSERISLAVYITVGCLGIVFNSLVLKVFVSLKDKSGVKLFIVALSASDCTTATAMVLRNTIQLASENAARYTLVYTVLTWFTLIALLFSQYLLAMIALDRFLAIFYPMTLKMSVKTQSVAIIIGLPIAGIIQSSMYYTKKIDDYYFVFLSSICFSFVVMCILYTLIIRRLVEHSANHRQKIRQLFGLTRSTVAPTEAISRVRATNVKTVNDESTVDKESNSAYTSQQKAQAKVNNKEKKLKLEEIKKLDSSPASASTTVAHVTTTSSSSSSPQQQYKIHLQTVRMTIVITLAYLASYIPWILSTWYIIPYPRAYLQTFFINVVSNPIVYAFMNRQFKKVAFGRCIRVIG